MRIGLIVDNPKRDLDGLLLVARQIVIRGHEAVLVPMYQQSIEIPLLKLDAILLNFLRPVNCDMVRNFKELGIKIFIMDTEGGVLSEKGSDSPKQWAKRFRDTNMSELVDGYFFWGDAIRDAFVEYSGMPTQKLITTGCPRYEFCNSKWRNFFDYPFKNFILINTNFSAINAKFSKTLDEEIQSFVSSGWERKYVQDLILDLKEVFKNYIDTIKKIAQKFPEKKIIVRAHPFENDLYYKNQFSEFKNILVYSDGNVLEAIANCHFMIHLNCGSSIETLLSGKIPVNLEFLNTQIQKEHTPLPRQISMNVGSLENLYEVIGNPEEKFKAFDVPQKYSLIESWFGPQNSKSSSVIAETISAIHPAGKISIKTSIKMSKTNSNFLQKIWGSLNLIAGTSNCCHLRAKIQKKMKDKFFSIAEVQKKLEKINKIENDNNKMYFSYEKSSVVGLKMSSIKISQTL